MSLQSINMDLLSNTQNQMTLVFLVLNCNFDTLTFTVEKRCCHSKNQNSDQNKRVNGFVNHSV